MTERAKAAPDADDDFRVKLIELLPYLRAFARTLCGNRDGADDLAQDAIKTAWQKRHMFEQGTNLKAWLFTIQRNSYYSTYRRVWRQTEWNEAAMERRLVTQASQVAGLELTDLKRAMTLLPDEQREALILVGAGGFQYHEAAAICGCAVGTMKSRVSRARHTLTSLLDNSVRLPASKEGAAEAYEGIVAELDSLSAQPHQDARNLRDAGTSPDSDELPSTRAKHRA